MAASLRDGAHSQGEKHPRDRPADDRGNSPVAQAAAVGAHRTGAGDVDDPVVRRPDVGEAVLAVVDHERGAQVGQGVQLVRGVDSGDLGPEGNRHLDGQRADTSTSTVDEHLLALADPTPIPKTDRRQPAGLGQGRGVDPAQLGRLGRESSLGCQRVLGERTEAGLGDVTHHLVPDREPRHTRPGGHHPTGEVGAEYPVLGSAQAGCPIHEGSPGEQVVVPVVHRRRDHLHEHLPSPGFRHRDALEAQNLRRSVAVVDGGAHRGGECHHR